MTISAINLKMRHSRRKPILVTLWLVFPFPFMSSLYPFFPLSSLPSLPAPRPPAGSFVSTFHSLPQLWETDLTSCPGDEDVEDALTICFCHEQDDLPRLRLRAPSKFPRIPNRTKIPVFHIPRPQQVSDQLNFSSLYSIYFTSMFHCALSFVFLLCFYFLFSFCGYYWINILLLLLWDPYQNNLLGCYQSIFPRPTYRSGSLNLTAY